MLTLSLQISKRTHQQPGQARAAGNKLGWRRGLPLYLARPFEAVSLALVHG